MPLNPIPIFALHITAVMKIDSHLPNTLILTSPVSWFNPSQQLCTATLSLSPPVGQEKESEEQKWENSWIDIKAVLQIK